MAKAPKSERVIVLSNDGHVILHGTKQDVSVYLRFSDGEVDFSLYPKGTFPAATDFIDDEYLEDHEIEADDGGTWATGTSEDLRAFEQELKEVAGVTGIRIVVPEEK